MAMVTRDGVSKSSVLAEGTSEMRNGRAALSYLTVPATRFQHRWLDLSCHEGSRFERVSFAP